jgi:hypothetical protein
MDNAADHKATGTGQPPGAGFIERCQNAAATSTTWAQFGLICVASELG